MTSRPEMDIKEALDRFYAGPGIELASACVDLDIRSYVDHMMKSDSKIAKFPSHVRQNIKTALTNMACGM